MSCYVIKDRRCAISLSSAKTTGRYGCLTTDTVPAFSILDGA